MERRDSFNTNLKYQATTTADYTEVAEWCQKYLGDWNDDWYKLGIDPLQEDKTSIWLFSSRRKQLWFILKWS